LLIGDADRLFVVVYLFGAGAGILLFARMTRGRAKILGVRVWVYPSANFCEESLANAVEV
jgi:hypothetical protein